MRAESRKNIPGGYGNVSSSPVKKPSSCSRCRKPAKYLLRNVFRSSSVCDDKECRQREESWVGNLPHTPRISEGSWASEKQRQADDRSFRVKKSA